MHDTITGLICVSVLTPDVRQEPVRFLVDVRTLR
jgi:hypothetical protein